MKHLHKYTSSDSPEISLKEFDTVPETHTFSKHYLEQKEHLISTYVKKKHHSFRKSFLKAAAIILFFTVILPKPLYAAVSRFALFDGMFGNSSKEDVVQHTETYYVPEKDSDITVTYPSREYVPINEEDAERLIGKNISTETITKQLDNYLLSIESVVSDECAMVVAFSLEQKDEAPDFVYDSNINETKGFYFDDTFPFTIDLEGYGNKIFIDFEKSTKEKMYAYFYAALADSDELPSEPRIQITWQDEKKETEYITLPDTTPLDSLSFHSPEGGKLKISPISIRVDCTSGEFTQMADFTGYQLPELLSLVEIYYTDGKTYLVSDLENNIDNTSYAIGTDAGEYPGVIHVFNRLVNVDKISKIVVNGYTYSETGE